MKKEKLTKDQALQKLRHYCRYQERCHSEVKNKLSELGVNKDEQDEMIMSMIEEDHLDEERFALAFTAGRFKMKQWGRKKIQYALKEKMVNEESIQKAIRQIDETNYIQVLKKLAKEKYSSLKNDPYLVRKKKTLDYLMQKGFEVNLIKTIVEDFTKENQ
jgi:regulatory protein